VTTNETFNISERFHLDETSLRVTRLLVQEALTSFRPSFLFLAPEAAGNAGEQVRPTIVTKESEARLSLGAVAKEIDKVLTVKITNVNN